MSDEYGCRFPLSSAKLGDKLGGPITLAPVGNRADTFTSLTSRADGLYAVVDPHVQGCGCDDEYGYGHSENDTTVRRLSWNDLGDMTTVATVHHPAHFDTIAISPAGAVFGIGGSSENYGGGALFGTSGGVQHELRDLPVSTVSTSSSLGSIAPWNGGGR